MADEQPQGRPNPITKAAESSSLPRQARARIGETTDPVPEGKIKDAAPELHFKVEPAGHDKDRAEAKPASELGLPASLKEIAQAHPQSHGHLPNRSAQQAGQDWMGSSTAANKLMDSRHRHNDYAGN